MKKDCRRRGKISEMTQKFAFVSFFFFVKPKVVSFMNLQLGFFFWKIPTKNIDGKKTRRRVRLRTQQIYFCIGIGSDCGISHLCTPPTSHRSSGFFFWKTATQRRGGSGPPQYIWLLKLSVKRKVNLKSRISSCPLHGRRLLTGPRAGAGEAMG